MILTERLFFMFSQKNPDNLWKKPCFIRTFFFIYTICSIYWTYYMGEQICKILGWGELIEFKVLFFFIIGLFYIVMVLLVGILIYKIVYRLIIDCIIPLFNEIKSSFKSHEEIMKINK